MFTIFDYIKTNNNISLKELSWNVIDNLVCSILAYLPTKGFNKVNSLLDIYEEVKELNEPESLGVVEPKSIEVLRLLLDSNRYSGLELRNFVKLKNNDTQFGAVTIRIKGITIVSFQGTDYSAIGWLENFRQAYQYPTYTQKLAIEYLNSTLDMENDNEVYVLGHSKGGNLAMVSVMECSDIIYNKIKQVYNFDGPGFREEEYNSNKYLKMSRKLTNIVPSSSVIGMILNNKSYQVIKPTCVGFYGHFPINWRIKEDRLINGELSYISKTIHKSATLGLGGIDNDIIKEAVESFFDAISENKASDIEISLERVFEIYNKLKLENPKVFKNFEDIFKNIIDAMKY